MWSHLFKLSFGKLKKGSSDSKALSPQSANKKNCVQTSEPQWLIKAKCL